MRHLRRGTPCETARGTVRGRYRAANAAPQVSFRAGTICTITKIYDQTANYYDLPIS